MWNSCTLQSNWSSLRRKYLSKIPTDKNLLSCGLKSSKVLKISDSVSPALQPQKYLQHVRAYTAARSICSKNSKIVPCHADSPNTRNGARLRFSVPDYSSCSKAMFVSQFLSRRPKVVLNERPFGSQ